jgi:hypothetical protein
MITISRTQAKKCPPLFQMMEETGVESVRAEILPHGNIRVIGLKTLYRFAI